MHKVILFDVDGVLALPEEIFSVIYTQSRGYDPAPFTNFFTGEWNAFVTGKNDLKQHIANNPNLWKWDGTPDELLDYWFKSEDIRNEALLETIRQARKSGIKCYVATEQEKYRTAHIRDQMFAGEFDGIFSTADISYKKNDPKFYEAIIKSLSVPANEILFFDDSQSKIDVALAAGLDAQLYVNVQQVRDCVVDQAI